MAAKPNDTAPSLSPIAVREDTAAAMLGVDVAALQNDRSDARRGAPLKFPYIKFGSRVLYRTDDLRAALDKLPHVEGDVA